VIIISLEKHLWVVKGAKYFDLWQSFWRGKRGRRVGAKAKRKKYDPNVLGAGRPKANFDYRGLPSEKGR